jgi:hypothetical protein
MNKKIAFILFSMAIAACGNSENNQTPQQRASSACEAEAKIRLGDKTYSLDLAALSQSAKFADDSWQVQAPITIEPGLRGEEKQTLSCSIRLQDGKPAEVTTINFIF